MEDPLAHARQLFFKELEALKIEFQGNPPKDALLAKVHKLKGGAGFLGYLEIEDKARKLDFALKSNADFEAPLAELVFELSNLLGRREG